MANTPNTQPDFATPTSSDSSTSFGGKTWFNLKKASKVSYLLGQEGANTFNTKMDSWSNYDGNIIDDNFMSKLLRLAGSTDYRNLASLETVDAVHSIIDNGLRKQGFKIFGSLNYHGLSQERKDRVKAVAALIRALPAFADTTRFSERKLLELAFDKIRPELEKEIADEYKLSEADLKALRAAFKTTA